MELIRLLKTALKDLGFLLFLVLVCFQACIKSPSNSSDSFESILSDEPWYSLSVFPKAGAAKLALFDVRDNQFADSSYVWTWDNWTDNQKTTPDDSSTRIIRYLILQDTGWQPVSESYDTPEYKLTFPSRYRLHVSQNHLEYQYDLEEKSQISDDSIQSYFPGKEWGFPTTRKFPKGSKMLSLSLALTKEVITLYSGYWECKDFAETTEHPNTICFNQSNKKYFGNSVYPTFDSLINTFNTKYAIISSATHPFYGYHFEPKTNLFHVYQISGPKRNLSDTAIYVGRGRWEKIQHHGLVYFQLTFPHVLPDSIVENQTPFLTHDIFAEVNGYLHWGRKFEGIQTHSKTLHLFNENAIREIWAAFKPKTPFEK